MLTGIRVLPQPSGTTGARSSPANHGHGSGRRCQDRYL
jgi:hypothetical protein